MDSGFVLPSLVMMEEYHYDWEIYLEALYQHFCRDFIHARLTFQGKCLNFKRYPMIKGKEATFWHLISEGQVESERVPDLRRCERILWPRFIIMSSQSEYIKVWKNRRRQEERIVLALEDFSYVVILADRGDFVLLWTAYCVEQAHRRRKLQQEYEGYIRTNS